MGLEVVGPEREARHLDGVAGPLRRRHRAHERLVAVADVRIDHVEVALVDRHVDRFADRPAAVMQMRRQVGQLHEVAEVLDRAVAPAVVQVAHERRAVVRGEDRRVAADPDVVRLVPGVLDELARRGCLDDLAAHPAREAHALALDVGSAVAQDAERLGVVAELDADLLEDRVGVVLDGREALLVENLERLERPREERRPLDVGVEPGGLAGRAAAASPAVGVVGHVRFLEAAATSRRRRRSPRAPAPPLPPPSDGRFGSSTRCSRFGNGATAGAGTRARRRSAPGSGARRRSRSSRPAA